MLHLRLPRCGGRRVAELRRSGPRVRKDPPQCGNDPFAPRRLGEVDPAHDDGRFGRDDDLWQGVRTAERHAVRRDRTAEQAAVRAEDGDDEGELLHILMPVEKIEGARREI